MPQGPKIHVSARISYSNTVPYVDPNTSLRTPPPLQPLIPRLLWKITRGSYIYYPSLSISVTAICSRPPPACQPTPGMQLTSVRAQGRCTSAYHVRPIVMRRLEPPAQIPSQNQSVCSIFNTVATAIWRHGVFC